MAINLKEDKLYPVKDLLKARLGRMPSRTTIWRWTSGGGAKGVKLEVTPVGQALYSTAGAVAEFFQNQAQARQRKASNEQVEEALRKRGMI